MADEVPTVPAPVADPAPLGLAAFALTTFLLSAANANWMNAATGNAWLGYALAYGGAAQLLAGMWEFKNRNVFGATAFSTYGAILDRPVPLGPVRGAARHEPLGGRPRPRLDPARVRDLQHLHAHHVHRRSTWRCSPCS